MTRAAKLEVMRALIRQASELKAAVVKARHPGLPEEDIEAETRRLVAGARRGLGPQLEGAESYPL